MATRPLGTGTICTPGVRSARKMGADSMVVALTAILICAFAAAVSKHEGERMRILVRNLGGVEHAQPVFAQDLGRRQIMFAQGLHQFRIVARRRNS